MFKRVLRDIGSGIASLPAGMIAGVLAAILVLGYFEGPPMDLSQPFEVARLLIIYGGLILSLSFAFKAAFWVIGKGFIWFAEYKPKPKNARVRFELYEDDQGTEREVGIIVTNHERRKDIWDFEIWEATLLAPQIDEKYMKTLNTEIATMKSLQFRWRDGDLNGNGLVELDRKRGQHHAIIAKTNSNNDTFSLTFNEKEIPVRLHGVYRIGIIAKGKMVDSWTGELGCAVEIEYAGGANIEAREIPQEKVNMYGYR